MFQCQITTELSEFLFVPKLNKLRQKGHKIMRKSMKQSGNGLGQIWGTYLFIAFFTENIAVADPPGDIGLDI